MISINSGKEPFVIGGRPISLTMKDYWQWAYSDLLNSSNRSVLAEFIVASSLGAVRIDKKISIPAKDRYGLLSPHGYRLYIISTAYIRSLDADHPDNISFRMTSQRIPDVYIFCVYKAIGADKSPLDLELWDFYVLKAVMLRNMEHARDTITFRSLMDKDPIWCDYYGIEKALRAVMKKNA